MIYFGIDNGVSGSIGVIKTESNFIGGQSKVEYFKMPTKRELNYTKVKQFLNRIDAELLKALLSVYNLLDSLCFIERPMINPMRFRATVSAIRALEATLIVLEELKIPYRYIDSREWQKVLLPDNLKGAEELKEASLLVGKRMFPQICFDKFNDADGLLIAEYCKRVNGK